MRRVAGCQVVGGLLMGSIAFATPALAKGPAAPTSEAAPGKAVTTPSGLQIIDVKIGKGSLAEKGKFVSVHYTGTLKDGTKFDSSRDRGNQPFSFRLGAGKVIKGWEEGIADMRVGGRRTLIIPANLAYGDQGFGAIIPPGSELHFDVELIEVL